MSEKHTIMHMRLNQPHSSLSKLVKSLSQVNYIIHTKNNENNFNLSNTDNINDFEITLILNSCNEINDNNVFQTHKPLFYSFGSIIINTFSSNEHGSVGFFYPGLIKQVFKIVT